MDHSVVLALLAYCACFISLKRFKPLAISILVTTILSIVFNNSSLYFSLIATVTVLHAIAFANNGSILSASKNILFAALFMLAGSIVCKSIEIELLFSLLFIKWLFLSCDHEIADDNIMLSSLGLLLSASLRYYNTELGFNTVDAILIGALTVSTRFILDGRIKNIAYIIAPLFVLTNNMRWHPSMLFVYTLALTYSLNRHNKINRIIIAILILSPFIDGSFIYNIVSRSNTVALKWAIIVDMSLSAMRYLEHILTNECAYKIRTSHIMIMLLGLTTSTIPLINEFTLDISNIGIPLLSAIPIIVLESRYAKFIERSKISLLMFYIYRTMPAIKLKKVRIANNKRISIVKYADDIMSKLEHLVLSMNSSLLISTLCIVIVLSIILIRGQIW